MKLFALCLLVGFAAATTTTAEWKWESQKEYHFQYSGRMLTGIPELSSQHSGFGINCTVVLKVQSPSRMYMTLEEPKFVRVNQELEPVDASTNFEGGINWRKLSLPEMEQVPEEYKQVLGRPVTFTLTNTGEVEKLTVSKEEPEWSVNYKKAIVALFQTKIGSRSQELEDNMVASELRNQWTVKEETVAGRCEAVYQVNQLPEYIVNENPGMIPHPEACSERKYFEITRTFNMNKCEKLASFHFFHPGKTMCGPNNQFNCDDKLISRTSNTRYIACGSRQQGLTIQSIVNDGEIRTTFDAAKDESMVSGSLQMLRLKEIKSASGSFSEPSQPIVLDGLMFEYGKQWYGQQQGNNGRIPLSQISDQSVNGASPFAFLNTFSGSSSSSNGNEEKQQQQIKTLLKEVAKDIHGTGGSFSKSEISAKLQSIGRGLMTLKNKNVLVSLYGSLEHEGSSTEETNTLKQLFIDACSMSGTPQAISFMKEMIMGEKIHTTEALHFFMWMPRYVLTPSAKVLEELFELVTSQVVKRNPTVYSVAITSYSQLVQSACVSDYRTSTYPAYVFGEFCNPTSTIVQSKLIPYLAREINNNDEIAKIHINALGLIRHKNVISQLTHIVEGNTQESSSRHSGASLKRILALYAIINAGHANPDLVIPILMSVYTNPSESTELRIISFNGLIKLNPPMHVFHAIAATTRQEPAMDYELLKTINIALYTLGHESSKVGIDSLLVEKAWSAYGLVRKTYGITPSSGTWYKTEFLRNLDTGYMGNLAWISSQESILPTHVYTQLRSFFGKYYVDVFEMGFNVRGMETVYEKLSSLLGGGMNGGDIKESIQSQLSGEWKEIIEKMQLKDREVNNVAEGSFFARFMESGIFFRSFGERMSQQLHEKISSMIQNPRFALEKVNGESGLNVQKTFNLVSGQSLVPTDMGFPIVFEHYSTVMASLNGKIELTTDKALPSFSVAGKAFATYQLSNTFATVLPFTGEYLLTGVNQNSFINVPGSIGVKFNVMEQKLSLSLKPLTTSSSSGPVDVFHHEVTPFTVFDRMTNLRPFIQSQNLKLIKSGAEYKQLGYSFGDFLGLDCKLETKTESSFTDFGSIFDLLQLYNYSPINMLLSGSSLALSETVMPSMRRHKVTVRFDPTESATKEIAMEFKFGYATKSEGSSQIEYHTMKVVSESERLSSGSIVKKILPYEIHSSPIGGNEVQQQKLSESMKGLETESATGFVVVYNLVLKGSSRPRTYSYTATTTFGHKHEESSRKISQKWDVQLDAEQGQYKTKKFCMNGKLDLPILPMWNIEDLRTSLVQLHFVNKIGMGSESCNESKIVVTGNAQTSHRQRTFSRESQEAKLCTKMTQQGIKGSKLSQVCESVRQQASALDEVDFKIEYVNVPMFVNAAEREAIVAVKGYLWPYYVFGKSTSGSWPISTTHQTLTRIVFKQWSPSYDLTIDGPNGHIVFNNVHINHPYSLFFPLKGNRNNAALAVEKLVGSHATPTCNVDAKTVTTFDNTTVSFLPGKCWHLLASDCSKYHRFGVFVRSGEGDQKEVKLMLKNTIIQLIPSSPSAPAVTVNGKHFDVPVHKAVHISSSNNEIIASAYRSIDGVITISAPSMMLNELRTDGEYVSVHPSPLLKNKMCGVCGHLNGQKTADIAGPGKCVYSRPEVAIASYRVPSESCQPMPENIKSELMKENEQCSKFEIWPTKIAKSYKAATGKCTILRHIVNQHEGELCISKVPVTQCGPSCQCSPNDVVEKSVPFTCLPQGRLAEHYARKAQRGQSLEELKSMKVSFSTTIRQPRHCVHSFTVGPSY